MREERAFGFTCSLNLPERVTAMADAGDVVQRSDVGEQGDFFFVERGDAQGQVVYGSEGAVLAALLCNGAPQFFTEAAGVAEAESE